MTLCNIHFHENAKHKGGEFAEYVGNGDGHGYGGGYQYSGALTAAERTKSLEGACPSDHGSLQPAQRSRFTMPTHRPRLTQALR